MAKNELKAFIGLSRTINRFHRELGKIHQRHDLTTGQFAVLEALYHKGNLCVQQVQEKILSTSGTIPVIIKNLESDGLLTRNSDPQDRRRIILSLTEKGRSRIAAAYPENETKIIELFGDLSPEELTALTALLKKLSAPQYNKP